MRALDACLISNHRIGPARTITRSTQSPNKSRTWTVVVAATALGAVGAGTVTSAWADTQVPAEQGVSLSQQRVITAEPRTQAGAVAATTAWANLASQVSTWSPDSIPALSGPFATAREAAAAADVQSASVQSVQSVASPVSVRTPVSVQSVQTPVSVQTPASVDSPDN